MNLLIKNGRLIDPASGTDTSGDLAIVDGVITELAQVDQSRFKAEEVIDAQGLWVLPGLVDLSLRLKIKGEDPQQATYSSEMRSALAGGVTSLVLPPDTSPVLDELGLVEMLKLRKRLSHEARIYPLGAMTVGLKGKDITEMALLSDAGCIAFSDATSNLPDFDVLQNCMKYANTYAYSLWLNPLDKTLGGGVAASGAVASRLGLKDVPEQAETVALHAIFELQRNTGVHIHICRVSSARGVELIRQAKREGLPVTCDVSINNLHLTDVDIGFFNADYRLNPPLRGMSDRAAITEGLRDGTIDAICSDHKAIQSEHKILPFAEAEPGAIGAELLLSLVYKWAKDNKIDVAQALSKVTNSAAAVLKRGCSDLSLNADLQVGSQADVVLFDPESDWVVSRDTLQSASPHTPFSGYALPGRVTHTIVGGKVSWQAK